MEDWSLSFKTNSKSSTYIYENGHPNVFLCLLPHLTKLYHAYYLKICLSVGLHQSKMGKCVFARWAWPKPNVVTSGLHYLSLKHVFFSFPIWQYISSFFFPSEIMQLADFMSYVTFFSSILQHEILKYLRRVLPRSLHYAAFNVDLRSCNSFTTMCFKTLRLPFIDTLNPCNIADFIWHRDCCSFVCMFIHYLMNVGNWVVTACLDAFISAASNIEYENVFSTVNHATCDREWCNALWEFWIAMVISTCLLMFPQSKYWHERIPNRAICACIVGFVKSRAKLFLQSLHDIPKN